MFLTEKDYEALYPQLKSFVIKYECGGNPEKFNEDIFQETGYKCLKIMRYKREGISVEEISKYFCKSYRNNCLREKLYFKNKMEQSSSNVNIKHDLYEKKSHPIDIDKISILIQKKFSKEIEILFKKHICSDVSISELERETGINNLKYQFSKIKKYLKSSKLLKELADFYGY